MRTISLFAAAFLSTAALPAIAQEVAVDPAFDAQVRSWIDRNPQVLLEAINRYVQTQQAQEQQAQDQNVLQLTDELLAADGSMTIGNPEGSIEMVYFLDAACGYCHRMSPVLDEVIAANPDLKIVQRWVPFLTPASTYAGVLANIVYQDAPQSYYAFYKNLMATEGQLNETLVDEAARKALGDQAETILAKAAAGEARDAGAASVEGNMGLAQRGAIQGTPFLMITGVGSEGILRGAVDATQLNAIVAQARNAG